MNKPFVENMIRAMADLKQAFSFSYVDNDGKLGCYEIDGTAKAIAIAVNALAIIRENGDAVHGEDGDGNV